MDNESKGICEVYKDRLEIRAIVQAIPFLGGPLDTLFAGVGAQISERRFLEFFNDLNRRLSNVEIERTLEPSEELWD